MWNPSRIFAPVMFAVAIASHSPAFADPLADVASFSVIKNADPAKLAEGRVIAARGPGMKFARGLSVESCFFVPVPIQKTVDRLIEWNPTAHRELKVYLHV